MSKIVSLRGRSRNGLSVTIENWIMNARTDTEKGHACTQFALVHRPSDKEIDSFTLGGSPGKSDQEVADRFIAAATSYAEGIAGVQQFELLAFYNTNEPQGFKPFTITGRTEFDGLSTEAPDGKGALAQGMRLTEMMVQGTFKVLSETHRMLNETHDRLNNENRDLRTENREFFGILKELMINEAKRVSEEKTQQQQYERQTQERLALMRMAPALVNNIVGKEIFPQSTTDTALITAISEHITPEQVQMMTGVLPPELMGPLAARLAQIQEEKNKIAARANELAKQTEVMDKQDPLLGEG
jgi:hypothetical protein